jgi:hypothetical protein
MTPPKSKPRLQPNRRRDYPLRKDPYLRQIWRVAYLDPDWGKCYAWAPTRLAAEALRREILTHYSHDTSYDPPEVFVGSIMVPLANRTSLATWLCVHASYEPPRPRYGTPRTNHDTQSATLEPSDPDPLSDPLTTEP